MGTKQITDLELRDSVTDDLSIPSDDGIQTYRVTASMILSYILAAGNVVLSALDAAIFSGLSAVTPSNDDYFVMTDTSDSNKTKKALVGSFVDAVYRSVTTTDAVGVNDETMKLSGASFTSTLPTAVGVSGKKYKFIHAGTSWSQAYSLATTSAQLIGGISSGAYSLVTNGEVLVIESDGANWIITGRVTDTAEVDLGPTLMTSTAAYVFTITSASVTKGAIYSNSGNQYYVITTISSGTTLTCAAFGTPGSPASSGTLTLVSGTGPGTITYSSKTVTGVPAKGSTTTDKMWVSRRSNKAVIRMEFVQATGTGGTGDVLFEMPANIPIDVGRITPFTTGATLNGMTNTVGVCNSATSANSGDGVVCVYSAYYFRLTVRDNGSATYSWVNGAFYGLGGATGYVAEFEVPVSGLQP